MRRKQPQQDSLELFLDTICNMFGGFIFIMLFVVVSIRSATNAKLEETRESELPAVSDAELTTMQNELDAALAQLERLERHSEDVKDFVNDLVSQEDVELYREALAVKEQTQELRKKNLEDRDKIEEAKRLLAAAEEENESLQEELKKALEEIQDAKRKRQRMTSPPKLEPTDKIQIPIFVRYGRVYFWHKYTESGQLADDFNDEDFFALEMLEDVVVATEPKPDGGVDLNADDAETRLAQAFRRFDPSLFYIEIVVSDDSFGEYNVVSSFLKRNGFGIHPYVSTKGEKIFDRGGRRQSMAQ